MGQIGGRREAGVVQFDILGPLQVLDAGRPLALGRALCQLDVAPPRAAQAREAFDRAVAVAEEQGAALLHQRAVETRAAALLAPHSGSDSHPAG